MYAGFWKRVGAFMIDWIVLFGAEILFIFIWAGFELLLNAIGLEQNTKELVLGVLGAPIYFLIPWLYYANFESSNFKATLGKQAVGIVVIDKNNNRISFGRASARFWSKILSIIILFIGFVMAAFTKEKQALHDIISSTYVINKDSIRSQTV